MTADYQKFEIIFDADGVPVTLFEIENWWANANVNQRRGLLSPDLGDDARIKIAQRIVQELRQRFSKEQLEIIRSFERQKIKVKHNWEAYKPNSRIGYDSDLESIKKKDFEFYSGETYEHNQPQYTPPVPPRPPDLNPIPDGDIFTAAMRKANEKLRREQEQIRARERYQQWQRQQAELNKPKEPKRTWQDVLGLPGKVSIEQLNKAFRDLAKKNHPDVGGSEEKMKELIDARNQALKEIG
jgi:hypothetical protein